MSSIKPLARTIKLYDFPKHLLWMFDFGDEIIREFWKQRPTTGKCELLKSVNLLQEAGTPTHHYLTTHGCGTGANFTFFMEKHPDKRLTVTVQFPAPDAVFDEIRENRAALEPVIEAFNESREELSRKMQDAVTEVWRRHLEKLPPTYYHTVIQSHWPILTGNIYDSKFRMFEQCSSAHYNEFRTSLLATHPGIVKNKFRFGDTRSVEFVYTFTTGKPGCACESLNATIISSMFTLMTDSQSIYSSRPEIADFAQRLERCRALFNKEIIEAIVHRKMRVETSACVSSDH